MASARVFAVSKYEVTFEDYDRFTYPNRVDDEGWSRGRRPVINVSWNDAQEYVSWLSRQTGQSYRLLSEAEWEYVVRAGSSTAYSWGNDIGPNRANCRDWEGLGTCGDRWEYTAPVGSFQANAFGVHDMHGNVFDWVAQAFPGALVLARASVTTGQAPSRTLAGLPPPRLRRTWVLAPYRLRQTAILRLPF